MWENTESTTGFLEETRTPTAQPPREGESLSNRGGGVAGVLAGDGIANDVASWIAIQRH